MLSASRILGVGCRSCQTILRGLLSPESITFESRQLKLRCPHCYFVRVDGRWEVRCSEYAKHHQKEPFDVKLLW
uniref:39S ribosomal protein L36, mitochondrial n=1 Tax=Elaeophora elaphi TaxID=1147741 RepID=A0A0R3RRC0_9BILA